ncbi:hypothetical protein EON82_02145, partial [bacterium]
MQLGRHAVLLRVAPVIPRQFLRHGVSSKAWTCGTSTKAGSAGTPSIAWMANATAFGAWKACCSATLVRTVVHEHSPAQAPEGFLDPVSQELSRDDRGDAQQHRVASEL